MLQAHALKKKSRGAPTWMVTFGDLMALLFTLFVLLFTYSTVDAEKYKALAGSLRQAFGSSEQDKLIGDQGGPMAVINLLPEFAKDPQTQSTQKVIIELAGPKEGPEASEEKPALPKAPAQPESKIEAETDTDEIREEAALKAAAETRDRKAGKLERELKSTISDDLAGADIEVEREQGQVLIRFPNEIAFSVGSAEITLRFEATLKSLTQILSATSGKIIVVGHTDNVPLSLGARYRSNWELSAARAAAVVHILLENEKMSAQRLTIQGFGDSRPRVDNDTPEHRAMNRRVEIFIQTDSENPK